MNRRIKQISPERTIENDGGECHNGRGFGFAVFAGLCPAKEWDAPSGLDIWVMPSRGVAPCCEQDALSGL
ncbi:MAG: hypothetical protein ACR2P4_01280, partial [Gammaproteobacteria bacterium]